MNPTTIYKYKFVLVTALIQIAFLILFGIFVKYGDSATPEVHKPGVKGQADGGHGAGVNLEYYYPMFQDIHIMMFIGFGFLMTFLKKYGYSSVGVNFLLAAVVIQWSTIVGGFIHNKGGPIKVNIKTMITSDFAAATVLISMGAVLGKISPIQYLVMAMCQIPICLSNEYLGLEIFRVSDIGGSIFIHAFGAYFGLAISRILYKKGVEEAAKKQDSMYHSDLFSMLGTIFLWMCWPSFNAAMADGDARHRAVLNTFYSLAACVVTTFLASSLLSSHGRFEMEHMQNSTLAGGVAVGTMADMMIQPWGAILVGIVAGLVSVFGFRYLTPFMNWKLGIHDTCGVNNLHGMPAILAAAGSAVTAVLATEKVYGASLYTIFPARAPSGGENSTDMQDLRMRLHEPHLELEPGLDRTASQQAGFQMIALIVTIVIAIVSGVVVGLILRLPIWHEPTKSDYFEDRPFWNVVQHPEERREKLIDMDLVPEIKMKPHDDVKDTTVELRPNKPKTDNVTV